MIKSFTCYKLICDGCGEDYPSEDEYRFTIFNSAEEALRDAQMDEGWAVYEGKHYCPDCIRKFHIEDED